MQYPILISVAEAARILSVGKTSIYARINDGSLKVAKMQRSTRITFSSVIEYALLSLQKGNGTGELSEIFGEVEDVQSWMVAEKLAGQLCHTRREPTEILGNNTNSLQSRDSDTSEARSPKKNFGGEL